MNNFEQEMKEAYEKLEQDMNKIASLFTNVKRKGYLGENIMLLDFSKKDFNNQNVSFETNENGWSTYEGINFRMVTSKYSNRIALTF